MKMQIEDIGSDITCLRFDGAFDAAGAQAIEISFAAIAGSRDRLAMDFSKVSFLASIGVRQLVLNAKAVTRRGGKAVLFGADDLVTKVLVTTGVTELIPVAASEAEAAALLTAAAAATE